MFIAYGTYRHATTTLSSHSLGGLWMTGGLEKTPGLSVDAERAQAPRKAFATGQDDFHKLAESLPQIVWITDANGKCIFFNRKWVEILKYGSVMKVHRLVPFPSI
jgi:PAS domain-containing protein